MDIGVARVPIKPRTDKCGQASSKAHLLQKPFMFNSLQASLRLARLHHAEADTSKRRARTVGAVGEFADEVVEVGVGRLAAQHAHELYIQKLANLA